MTCPNGWGIVGEHRFGTERLENNVMRGIIEELGEEVWSHVKKVQNLTTFPVYMRREVGEYGNNHRKRRRVDHQLIYMWAVTLDQRNRDVILQLDDEVSEHQWIDVDAYSAWVKQDLKNDPPKDFCHPIVAGLRNFEIDRLKEAMRAANQTAER